jgi:hypothetical protein
MNTKFTGMFFASARKPSFVVANQAAYARIGARKARSKLVTFEFFVMS